MDIEILRNYASSIQDRERISVIKDIKSNREWEKGGGGDYGRLP